jgi:hypothetical protein
MEHLPYGSARSNIVLRRHVGFSGDLISPDCRVKGIKSDHKARFKGGKKKKTAKLHTLSASNRLGVMVGSKRKIKRHPHEKECKRQVCVSV